MTRHSAMAARRLACRLSLAAAAVSLSCAAGAADEDSTRQLASDRGCFNCHAEPSRRSIRSFVEIAKAYEGLRGNARAEQQARDRMHHGGLFSHIAAHERLSEEEATRLVRWLFEGGR